jgi:single-strand DNA-binding protein
VSKDLNQCNFIGRISKDVELRYSASGTAMANISLACGDDYKDKSTGSKVEQTNWINIVLFGKAAELASEYLKKGSKVFFSGKYRTRKWENKEGITQYTTEIVASEMQFLDSKPAGTHTDQSQHQADKSNGYQPQQGVGGDDFDDDLGIPF